MNCPTAGDPPRSYSHHPVSALLPSPPAGRLCELREQRSGSGKRPGRGGTGNYTHGMICKQLLSLGSPCWAPCRDAAISDRPRHATLDVPRDAPLALDDAPPEGGGDSGGADAGAGA
eukprot:3091233-Pyramimonas_sp.AAC.1